MGLQWKPTTKCSMGNRYRQMKIFYRYNAMDSARTTSHMKTLLFVIYSFCCIMALMMVMALARIDSKATQFDVT